MGMKIVNSGRLVAIMAFVVMTGIPTYAQNIEVTGNTGIVSGSRFPRVFRRKHRHADYRQPDLVRRPFLYPDGRSQLEFMVFAGANTYVRFAGGIFYQFGE